MLAGQVLRINMSIHHPTLHNHNTRDTKQAKPPLTRTIFPSSPRSLPHHLQIRHILPNTNTPDLLMSSGLPPLIMLILPCNLTMGQNAPSRLVLKRTPPFPHTLFNIAT